MLLNSDANTVGAAQSQPNQPPRGPQPSPRQDSKGNAATGASAAGARAFTSQLLAFYFRAPVKVFFRTRVE